MRLYLIQHGDAFSEEIDPERALTPAGVQDVETIGNWVAHVRANVPAVWHSGKLRAWQTAERLAPHLAPAGDLVEKANLNPKDPVASLAKEISRRTEDLAIVGHLPHLSKLAGLLLAGDANAAPVAFEKGGMVCLERGEQGQWQVHWMVVPSLLLG